MFDYHMHSVVSFDGHDSGLALARAAVDAGLREICFTAHQDFDPAQAPGAMAFTPERYSLEYDGLEVPGLKIRRGVEFGITPDNCAQAKANAAMRPFDFILGSVHFVKGLDEYCAPYFEGKTQQEAEQLYLEEALRCVQIHRDYDVLAHLTYLSKSPAHPTNAPMAYGDNREIVDEILKALVANGKGLEMNTSGVDRGAGFLPGEAYFRRFRELGGEIVTVGSDAHRTNRVGQYCREACEILKDIFGYVCTFENRTPIFHKL